MTLLEFRPCKCVKNFFLFPLPFVIVSSFFSSSELIFPFHEDNLTRLLGSEKLGEHDEIAMHEGVRVRIHTHAHYSTIQS